MRIILAGIAALAIAAAGSAARAECLAYGAAATLDGWLSLKPATAEQIAAGAKGPHWSIKLAKPACTAADAANAAIASVPRVALAVAADQDKALRAQFGMRVQVSGTLRASDPAKAGAPVTLEGATLATK